MSQQAIIRALATISKEFKVESISTGGMYHVPKEEFTKFPSHIQKKLNHHMSMQIYHTKAEKMVGNMIAKDIGIKNTNNTLKIPPTSKQAAHPLSKMQSFHRVKSHEHASKYNNIIDDHDGN